VVVEADAGWFAYANPVGVEIFGETARKSRVGAKGKIETFQGGHPPGKGEESQGPFGNFKIYEGRWQSRCWCTGRRATQPVEIRAVNI